MIPPASGQICGKSLQTMEHRKFHSGLKSIFKAPHTAHICRPGTFTLARLTPGAEKIDKAVFKTFATLYLLSSEPRINNMFTSWELLQVKQTFLRQQEVFFLDIVTANAERIQAVKSLCC